MAKVIAPFVIKGTIQNMNFYVDENGINRVRESRNTGVSPEVYRNSPNYQKVRNHSKEFGHCTQKAKSFRMTAFRFFDRAKDGSFSGRANKLMLDIVNEDIYNDEGERTVENGLKSVEARSYFVGFEGNKNRPLSAVLKTEWDWDEEKAELLFKKFDPAMDIDWPEQAQQVHLATAYCVWDYTGAKFNISYSEEVVIQKTESISEINLKTEYLPKSNDELELAFLFIGFSYQDRRKTKELKRSFNTVSVIWSR